MKILAKSDPEITLSQHTKDVLEVLNFIEKHIPEKLYNFIEIAVLFHDIGKVIPAFQIKTLGNKDYSPWDVAYEIPHSFFSVFWIDFDIIAPLLPSDDKDTVITYTVSSIAYHHWREGYEKYLHHNCKEFKDFCKKVLEWEDVLRENLKKELSGLNSKINLEALVLNKKWLNGIINGRSFTSYAIPPYKFDYEPLRQGINKDWILISGFLQRCDHFASFCEKEDENLQLVEITPVPFESIKSGVINKLNSTEDKIWQLNKLNENKLKEVESSTTVLVAPTGYGKTEFAFLWSKGKKFVYTLPLRAAVNQIFNRSLVVFGNNKAGILHSDADVYLLSHRTSQQGDEESSRVYSLSRQLSYPVIISTGDQFFPYALRPPGYEKVFSLFSYAGLVIDEVQAYDPKACAIIVKFLQWVKLLGGRFLLMTATLPEFVRKEIENFDKEPGNSDVRLINIYEEEKENLKKIFKHKLEIITIENPESKRDSLDIPDRIIRHIIAEAKKNQRVLVILNTVEQAQKVYKEIKKNSNGIKTFLLHSRFTFKDREIKEVELIGSKEKKGEFSNPKPEDEKEGKILVATQVVEASLDIDADVLFTEICPLDSLVQRMGRVLRRYFYLDGKVLNKSNKQFLEIKDALKLFGENPNVYVMSFEPGYESGKGRVYDKKLLEESLNILESMLKTSSDISEFDKYDIVQKLYQNLPEDSNYLKEFYQTLHILDAGYMSEKKDEAFRIFREIYTVPAIPAGRLKYFKKDIEEFVKKPAINYTLFKMEVLSKHVVNMDRRKYSRDDGLQSVSYIINEMNLEKNIERRIKDWLSDIYIFDGAYNSEIGVYKEESGQVSSDPDNII